MDRSKTPTPSASRPVATDSMAPGYASLAAELPFDQPVNPTEATRQTEALSSKTPDVSGPPSSTTRSLLSDRGERIYGETINNWKREIPRIKMPKFKGEKVSRFIRRLELEYRARNLTEREMAEFLPMYVDLDWLQLISELPGYETRDWNLLKRSMKDTFGDEEKYKYSLDDLRAFVAKQRRKGRPERLSKISKVYFQFAEISSYLKGRKAISPQEESRYFLKLLPTDIVDMIYSRRDTRQLVKTGGDVDEDEDDASLPEVKDILKELRAIFASFAKRGKMSKIRGKRQWASSDSESDSDIVGSDSDSLTSSEDETERTYRHKPYLPKRSHSRSHASTKSTKTVKSSRSSDSDREIERMRMPLKRKHEHKEEPGIRDLLQKFSELNVTVTQLATNQAQMAAGNTAAQAFGARRNSFGASNGLRPAGFPPTQNPNPNMSRWPAPRRDPPPHETNTTAYEASFVATGANTTPVSAPAPNQWGARVQPTYNPPNAYAPPRPPTCLWCAGEDGDPHIMYTCKDLDAALASGIVRRDPENKLRYGMRYIPGRAHPRGMRAWVREQEDLAKASVRDQNVRFTEVNANSVEYDPPEISEGRGDYEASPVRVDEFDVNAGKRTRSVTSDGGPPKDRKTRAPRPRESLFEELGVPKGGELTDRDTDAEMQEVPKRRQPPKTKLESAFESRADPKGSLERLLRQPVTLPISEVFANSPELAKQFANECRRRRAPAAEPEANHVGWGDETNKENCVNAGSYEGRKKSYYAGVLAFAKVNIGGETHKALLDNGSIICMMQDDVRRHLGLPIRTDGTHRVRMAGGSLETLMGISEDVPVRIGGVTTYVHFFISKGSTNPILLGQNFLRQVEANFVYHADGSVLMRMTHRGRQITVEVTSKDETRYLANVPGEAKDYDSSVVELENGRGELSRQRPSYCIMCAPTSHQVCQRPLSPDSPCAKPRGSRATLESPPRPVAGTRINEYGAKIPVYACHPDYSPDPTIADEAEPSHLHDDEEPRYQGGASVTRWRKSREGAAQKGKNKAVKKAAAIDQREGDAPRPAKKGRGWRKTRRHSTRPKSQPASPENPPSPEASGSGTCHEQGDQPSPPEAATDPVVDDLMKHALKLHVAEEAVLEEVTQQILSNDIVTTRTGPWIEACSDEEAIERAQLLRDEYDKFLTVLFGRRIRLMTADRSRTPENTPEPSSALSEVPHKMRRPRSCGSMMFSAAIVQNFDPDVLTTCRQNEELETRKSTDAKDEPSRADDPEFSFQDWVNDQLEDTPREVQEEAEKDEPSEMEIGEVYEEAREVDPEPPFESALTLEAERQLARELGLEMNERGLETNLIEFMNENFDEGLESEIDEDPSDDGCYSPKYSTSSSEDLGAVEDNDEIMYYGSDFEEGLTALLADPLLFEGRRRAHEVGSNASGDEDEASLSDLEYLDQLVSAMGEEKAKQRHQRTNKPPFSDERDPEQEDNLLFEVHTMRLEDPDEQEESRGAQAHQDDPGKTRNESAAGAEEAREPSEEPPSNEPRRENGRDLDPQGSTAGRLLAQLHQDALVVLREKQLELELEHDDLDARLSHIDTLIMRMANFSEDQRRDWAPPNELTRPWDSPLPEDASEPPSYATVPSPPLFVGSLELDGEEEELPTSLETPPVTNSPCEERLVDKARGAWRDDEIAEEESELRASKNTEASVETEGWTNGDHVPRNDTQLGLGGMEYVFSDDEEAGRPGKDASASTYVAWQRDASARSNAQFEVEKALQNEDRRKEFNEAIWASSLQREARLEGIREGLRRTMFTISDLIRMVRTARETETNQNFLDPSTQDDSCETFTARAKREAYEGFEEHWASVERLEQREEENKRDEQDNSTDESRSLVRSETLDQSEEEERRKTKPHSEKEKSAATEDEVSTWWKAKFGTDERAEGRALVEPWFEWALWDRRRKWFDRQQAGSDEEERMALAEENTHWNSRYSREDGGTRASRSAEPPGMSLDVEPSGTEAYVEPSRRRRARSLQERPRPDLDEDLSMGSLVKEALGWRKIVVPRGTYTPGEVIKLRKGGVEVVWEGSESSEEEESARKKIKLWRTKVPSHPAGQRGKEWRSASSSSKTGSESGTTHVSDSEKEEEIEVTHKGSYLYAAGTVELLGRGLSPRAQKELAEAVQNGDPESYNAVIYEVNTKYKPVGKKVLPVPIALPPTDNPPLRRPPLSRDPYGTPLTPKMPKFEAGGKLTEERLALMDFGPEGWLTVDEKNLVLNVLRLRERALAFDGTERGKLKRTYGDPYKIPVVPHTPWRQPALPIPLAARDKIIETFKARMEEGLYERSTSAYSGRWFVVAKKDGKYRIVHDLQPLNAVTIRDAGYPPVIEEFIEDFTGRACLGLADVYGGFDQRELAEESRQLTTMMTPMGPVQLTRLPQGATNSPAEYQRVMVHVLAEEIPEYAGVFIDDVGIKGPSSTYNNEKLPGNPEIRRFVWEYAVTLERVLFRFEEAGLTISGPKAAVIVPALNIVGTICSMEGRRMSKASRNKIANFPVPRDVSEVRGFLGICTYVRNWIERFADVARPLRDLTRNGAEFVWSEACQQSFDKLKQIVGKDLLLNKLEYGANAGRIILAVDSSQVAAGGVIFQEDSKGKRRPARYESLTFTETEARYSQPKLELAGVAKILKKLQMFLWGQHFVLEIDASALVQMLNAPELPNAPMNRWLRFIQLFDFEVVHVPGKKHTLADGLSRARRDENDDVARDLDSLISAHLQLVREEPIYDWRVAFVEADYESDEGLLAIGKYLSSLEKPEGLTKTQWIKFQTRAKGFALENGRLYRRRGGMLREVVLDPERQDKFLRGVHDETGHRGREETSRRISERVWWPGWSQTVREYVRSCDKCQLRKPNQEREARNPSMSAGFLRKFNMDVTHIKEGTKPYLLTAREDLTGWVEGKALPKITSKAVSDFIRNTLIPRFGWFYQATVDGGAEFKGEVVEALRDLGIRRVVIAPYHPEANGMEERGHQPIVDCLVKVSDSPKQWARHLPMVLFADRISMRRPTGMTPFAMVYGTEAVLPIDQTEETWLVSNWRDATYSRSDLLAARFAQLERKSERVAEATERLKAARLAAVLYHDRVNAHRLRDPLAPGELVLVHNAQLDSLHGGKFLARWTGPYRVRQRLTKGSYLLEELDKTPLKKVYAARRVRRYYPRGKREVEIKREEIPGMEELPEEEWNGEENVPPEDLEEGEEIGRELTRQHLDSNEESEPEPIKDPPEQEEVYVDPENYFEDADMRSLESEEVSSELLRWYGNNERREERQVPPREAPREPIFELPQEELRSSSEDSSSEDEELTDDSAESARPARETRVPRWLVEEGWNLGGPINQGPKPRLKKRVESKDSPVKAGPRQDIRRRRGRPRKEVSQERDEEQGANLPSEPKSLPRRKRGRPRKNITAEGEADEAAGQTTPDPKPAEEVARRKPGRPRKEARRDDATGSNEGSPAEEDAQATDVTNEVSSSSDEQDKSEKHLEDAWKNRQRRPPRWFDEE
ncbi:hypothetical protein P7C70_g5540, partial [Phenoliferia sp. Uapishka_3]